jgi:hypothetical protein
MGNFIYQHYILPIDAFPTQHHLDRLQHTAIEQTKYAIKLLELEMQTTINWHYLGQCLV